MVSVALRVGLVVAFLLLPQHVKAGDEADQTRLKQVIKDSVKPKPVKHKTLPPDVQALLAWSEPVNGLAARIEYVWAEHVFFVRLKNVSDRPSIVPMARSLQQKGRPVVRVVRAARN